MGTSKKHSGLGVPLNRKANEELYEGYKESSEPVPEIEVTEDDDKEVEQQLHHDELTHSEATLHHYNFTQCRKVKERTLSNDGSVINAHNENPILNTLACDIGFDAANAREHKANKICDIVLSSNNADIHITMALQNMLNYRKDVTACGLKDEHVYLNGQRKLGKSAKGWNLEELWKDGTTDYLPLEDLKK